VLPRDLASSFAVEPVAQRRETSMFNLEMALKVVIVIILVIVAFTIWTAPVPGWVPWAVLLAIVVVVIIIVIEIRAVAPPRG
jgi:F0F1-type ATP synthase assembly protein I